MKRYLLALAASLLLLLGLTACGTSNTLLLHNQSGRDITSLEVSYGEYGQYAVNLIEKNVLKQDKSQEFSLDFKGYDSFDLRLVDSYGTVYDFFNLPVEWTTQNVEISIHATGRRQLTLQVLLYDAATHSTTPKVITPNSIR